MDTTREQIEALTAALRVQRNVPYSYKGLEYLTPENVVSAWTEDVETAMREDVPAFLTDIFLPRHFIYEIVELESPE